MHPDLAKAPPREVLDWVKATRGKGEAFQGKGMAAVGPGAGGGQHPIRDSGPPASDPSTERGRQ
eukprot:428031-Alexandrium_andersonii.AAC.1